MGVMSCDREGCGKVMCDRYSLNFGYICQECFDELVQSGIETRIAEFMRIPKDITQGYNIHTQEIFDQEFRLI